ncbi:MAG: MBL fold metallo-hydrolase [Theionarchaea archaeon]|nr:MBL fold metallo-hydrolase [Theionarchaea archaeon]MBU7036138.1 MBL fold metallo-hydrolase [Theionarchaea archaeon]
MTKIYTLVEDYSGYESPFLAQHGVSFLIEGEKTILVDTGQDAFPLLYNMNKLGLDPGMIDYIFLSHCHYDHTGGLLDVLKTIDRKIPIIAHSTIFRPHFSEKESENVGIPFSQEIVQEYCQLVLRDSPFEIMRDVYSTGEITQREGFEKEALEKMKVYTLEDGNPVKDWLMDDMSIVMKTPEGLVIVTGCSHAGIVSIVNHAMSMMHEKRIRAVIGGFHLITAGQEHIEKTIEAFRAQKVQEVYTGHCTGLKAEAGFMKEWGEHFHKLHSGMVILL